MGWLNRQRPKNDESHDPDGVPRDAEEPEEPEAEEDNDAPFIGVYSEHVPGAGEDAPPLLSRSAALMAVFDGMGGAGSEQLNTPEGPRSGAYLASRAARATIDSCRHLLLDYQEDRHDSGRIGSFMSAPPADSGTFTRTLAASMRERLADLAAETGAGTRSRLKSKLIRPLPTTMAAAWYDVKRGTFHAVWAGDSRVYLLSPEAGLQQVSTDDLKTKGDALENLTEDSPMSNCISADGEFILHQRSLPLPPKAVVFTATDGCFGYVPTPFHFEHMLLRTMQEAASYRDWNERLQAAIVSVAKDDASLMGAILGWPNFVAVKVDFAGRFKQCAVQVRQHDDLAARVDELHQALEDAKKNLADGRAGLWRTYRTSYEELLSADVQDFPATPAARPRQPEPRQPEPRQPEPRQRDHAPEPPEHAPHDPAADSHVAHGHVPDGHAPGEAAPAWYSASGHPAGGPAGGPAEDAGHEKGSQPSMAAPAGPPTERENTGPPDDDSARAT
jgi:hypothetical protein